MAATDWTKPNAYVSPETVRELAAMVEGAGKAAVALEARGEFAKADKARAWSQHHFAEFDRQWSILLEREQHA